MHRISRFVILAIALWLLAGCGSGSSALPEQEAVEIYQVVIRQVYEVDDTFGGTLEKPVLYLVRATTEAAWDPSVPPGRPEILPEGVQRGISEALSDLPTTIVWVDDFEQVELDESGQALDGGVIVTLGNIEPVSDERVLVAASIYVANLAAGGQTYVVERRGTVWTITGTSGPTWVS